MRNGDSETYWRTAGVVIALSLVGAVLIYFEAYSYVETAKQNALQIASAEASVLSQRLNASISLTYTLEALLREKNYHVDQETLDKFSSHLLESHPSVSSLQYAPNGIVSFISPMAGNESALGHNLLKDPKRNKEAFDSVKKKTLTVAGPFELIQGGTAIVARKPIFQKRDGVDSFWGFSTTLLKVDDLMNSTTINSLSSLGYTWNIYRIHPDTKQPNVFYGPASSLLSDAVQIEIKAPNVIWFLNLKPSQGWLQKHNSTLFLLLSIWIFASLTFSYLAYRFFKLPRELQLQVAARTAELQMAKDILAQSEQRLMQIAENSQMWIWEVDANGRYTYCSNACEAILGYRAEEIIGKKFFYDLFHPQDRESMKAAALKAFEQKLPFNEFENRNLSKSGETVWLSTSGVPIVNDQGELLGYRGADIDITSRKRLAEEHARAMQLAALGTVAAGVAHEINNPIQGIMNFAALIEKHPNDEQRVPKAASRIVRESERIAKITQSLLNYSKDARVEKVPSDIRTLIEEALSLIATKSRNSGVLLKIDIPQDLPKISIQPQSIQQVILNLVDNATDALKEKMALGEKGEITVKTELVDLEGKEVIRISVEDNGSGMPQSVAERAFEAFYTTKPPSQGTGLGLSIVKDIVTKHDGTLSLETTEGQGTRVKLDIPTR